MFPTRDKCPLCESDADRTEITTEAVQRFKGCRCSEYKISDSFLALIRAWRAGTDDSRVCKDELLLYKSIDNELLDKLSAAARRAVERGEKLLRITEETQVQ